MKFLKTQIQQTRDKSKQFRKEIPDTTTSIHISQYNINNLNLEKKI